MTLEYFPARACPALYGGTGAAAVGKRPPTSLLDLGAVAWQRRPRFLM